MLSPLLYGEVGTGLAVLSAVARWGAAAALLTLAVGLLVRHGPDRPQSLGWVSVGAGLVIGSWLAMSALFLLYLTSVASYGSLFGNLATIVVLMGYLYLSSATFLAGIQMDALLRERHAR
jgi:membrane protein